MKKIYADSWRLFLNNAPALVAIILFFETLIHLPLFSFAGVIYYPVYIFVAYQSQKIFLSGGSEGSNILSAFRSNKDFQLWTGAKFSVACMLLEVLPLLIFVLAVVFALGDQWEQMLAPINLAGLILGGLLLHTFVKAVLGTILPAIIDTHPDFTLAAALKYWTVLLGRLFMGATPFLAASIALALLAIGDNSIFGPQATYWLSVGLSALVSVIDLFGIILSSATLCSVYRMIVPAPILNAQ